MPNVAIPLQELQKTLIQFEKDFCFLTLSQKAVLEKYFDLFRNSQKELKKLSHQCQNNLRVAQQVSWTIYNTINARTFILFVFTVNISIISKKKTTNLLISIFWSWRQNRKILDSLKIITKELCQEYVIDELFCNCSGAIKSLNRRSRSKTIDTHKQKTRGKKHGDIRIMTINILMILTQGRTSTQSNFI